MNDGNSADSSTKLFELNDTAKMCRIETAGHEGREHKTR